MVRQKAFTLIELLVVMAIVALLLTLVAPRYFGRLEAAKETALKYDLATMREAIDKFRGDHDRYPESFGELVAKEYLRRLPPDPITESPSTWIWIPAPDGEAGIADVRSGAPGQARDGTSYADW